jgi:hypothetical protein
MPSGLVHATKPHPGQLGVQRLDAVLAEPFDPVVFERATTHDRIHLVAASQLAADLLTGPGREPSEGNELLSWMRANEEEWRA